jgi:DNA-binding winged helix-turn-helix (wHTH) protein/TolB-like protein
MVLQRFMVLLLCSSGSPFLYEFTACPVPTKKQAKQKRDNSSLFLGTFYPPGTNQKKAYNENRARVRGTVEVENDYRLGDWLIQPQRGCIGRGGEIVHLKPKAMAVLDCLAEASGEVVRRDDLFERVWPGQVVSDATLTQCVVELRQAFGDSARSPRVIETIPKIGFRLMPPVSIDDGQGSGGTGRPDRRSAARWPFLIAVILAILFMAIVWYPSAENEQKPLESDKEGRSLAVLPFNDVSPDSQQEWVAASLTEQLINRLSRLEGLEVIGKTASVTLENGQADLKAVARELGVDFIVEGSVFRTADDFRITTRLVEVATAKTWWAYEWTPTLEQFLAMQEIIAEGVAIALSIELDVGELGLDPMGPSDVEAFWSVDTAMRSLAFDTREAWLSAVREIDNAVERDPGYPDAWLWASFIYGMAEYRIGDIVHRDWKAISEHALDQALNLAPNRPETLFMLVNKYVEHGRYMAAERAVERFGALESVSHPMVLFHTGIARNHVGRCAEALVLLERAQLLDPDGWAHFMRMLGWAYLLNGRTEDALAMYERAWGNEDVMRGTGSSEGLFTALANGDPRTIRLWLMRAQEFSESGMLRFYLDMEANLDDPAAATAFLRGMYENPYEGLHDPFIAIWAAYHGDHQLAKEAMLRTPNSWYLWHPLMSEVRKQDEIEVMLRELGLVNYWREYAWGDFCRPVGDDGFECE